MFPASEPTSARMGLSAILISAGLGRFPHGLSRTARFRHPQGTSRMRLNLAMRRFRSAFAPDVVRRELPGPYLRPLTTAMSLMAPAIIRCSDRTLRPVNISMKSIPPGWILTRSATPWDARAHQREIGFSFPLRRLLLHFEMRRQLRERKID
jgi:hypothetical protein